VTRARILLILLLLGFLLFVLPALRQDENYHHFADRRFLLGIPNFWNVISNAPFAIVGVLGLLALSDFASRILFTGVLLTAFGSAYYHWAPDDARLVWDRLPMTIVFMTLFALVIAERVRSPAKNLLPMLLCCGIASVFWWRFTGNLWPYVLVQFVPMLAIPALLAMRPGKPGLWPVIVFYGLAKLAEQFDAPIYSALPLSGHTLKHLLGAGATWFILRWRRYC
jgi:ceramidase